MGAVDDRSVHDHVAMDTLRSEKSEEKGDKEEHGAGRGGTRGRSRRWGDVEDIECEL